MFEVKFGSSDPRERNSLVFFLSTPPFERRRSRRRAFLGSVGACSPFQPPHPSPPNGKDRRDNRQLGFSLTREPALVFLGGLVWDRGPFNSAPTVGFASNFGTRRRGQKKRIKNVENGLQFHLTLLFTTLRTVGTHRSVPATSSFVGNVHRPRQVNPLFYEILFAFEPPFRSLIGTATVTEPLR